MDELDQDLLGRSLSELGEPDSLYRISRGRFLTKLAIGALLVVVGLIANYLWWFEGGGGFHNHFVLIFLIGLPFTGMYLLIHMFRQRGLVILIYPTGLLRLCRGEIGSFPWQEIVEVRVKIQRTDSAEFLRDPDGNLIACWLPATAPTFKLWNTGLSMTREDGVECQFSSALTDYSMLAEEVQRRTFAVLWPRIWERFLSGSPVPFGDVEVSILGIRHGGKLIRWGNVKELSIIQGKIRLKQGGKWMSLVLTDVYAVANPHLLFALVREAQRAASIPNESVET